MSLLNQEKWKINRSYPYPNGTVFYTEGHPAHCLKGQSTCHPPRLRWLRGRKAGASQERASRGNRGSGQWEPPPGRGQRFHSSSQDERLRVVLGSISSLKEMSPLIQPCRTPATAQDSQPRELLPDPPIPGALASSCLRN